jgi:C_GCAxxG_C_C family probable redox protein
MTRIEEAADLFRGCFNCAQSVLSVFAAEMNLSRETALKIATPFGSGLAGMCGVCGAVSGALMVIGLKYGMGVDGDRESKERTYAMARDFARHFTGKHGSINCQPLIGYDLGDPVQRAAAQQAHVFETRCAGFVTDSVEILEQILSGQDRA